MNPWQMAQQLKYELETVRWAEGSQGLVFGSHSVWVGSAPGDNLQPNFPLAVIVFGAGAIDREHPEVLEQNFRILAFNQVFGDPVGSVGVIGGSSRDLGQSPGRGSEELLERIRSATSTLTGADGAKVLVTGTGTVGSEVVSETAIVVSEVNLLARCSSGLHYDAPQKIARSGNNWSWEGSHCESRFDFDQYRLTRKAGSSPSTTPLDGTVVYTGALASTTIPAIPGYTYTIFADYNARKRNEPEGTSEAEVGTYLVVV